VFSISNNNINCRSALIGIFIMLGILIQPLRVSATHSMGMDLTYNCLGGDTFEIELTFYRDCAGVDAPGIGGKPLPVIDITSGLCTLSFNVTLPLISFVELNAVCSSLQTTCSGGTYPGVEQYIYRDTIVIPDTCSDWKFSYALCCRNNAINTINPTNVDIYVETTLDNLNTPCNSSPVFTNTPVPFMCDTLLYCFNNGAVDLDGDSLVYTLITPTIGPLPGDTVNYLAGYDAFNPVTSSPPLTFDPITGDICLRPTVVGEVSVMQVRIEEWRNGVQIGYIDRDIQLRVIDCVVPNTLPSVDGINGTGVFTASICAGDTFSFFTNTVDPDTSQNITMTWNAGISGSAFDTTTASLPVGTFSWLPDTSDISTTPHCFTVTVTDDNCPFLGMQTFSFCLTVFGFMSTSAIVQDASCTGICDGQATVSVTGGVLPYVYLWNDPLAQTNATATNLCAGPYNVIVTDSVGCSPNRSITVNEPLPLVFATDSTLVSCTGASDGTATVTPSGGTPLYTYSWDANTGNQTTATAVGLAAGTYFVTVDDANGCTVITSVVLLDPPVLSISITDSINPSCTGTSDGQATVTPIGGVAPYNYLWDAATGNQTDSAALNLSAGTYSVTVTDTASCSIITSVTLLDPAVLVSVISSSVETTCFGGSDGSATVSVSGGTSPYTYLWDIAAGSQTDSTAIGLSAGTYSVIITDANGCSELITAAVSEPSELTLVVSNITPAACKFGNDGSATVDASGSFFPYTYLWDDPSAQTTKTATGLYAGIYMVVVTDSVGCTADTTVTITEPASALIVTTSVTNVSCTNGNDGTATASVTGGTFPYTFIWNDPNSQTTIVATGLASGNYTVTVTDNIGNCLVDTSAVITEPSTPLNTSVSQTDVNCNSGSDGTATSIPSGGTSPYTFIWNDAGAQTTSTANGLIVGTYSVTITDNTGNCIIDTGIVVNEPLFPLTLIINVTAIACFGFTNGVAEVNASGGTSPYTYQWDVSAGSQTDSFATGLSAGTYSVSVTDTNGCLTADTSVIIIQPLFPLSLIMMAIQVSCNAGNDGVASANVSGGTPPYKYTWNDPGSQTDSAATGLQAGTYNLIVTDANECNITGDTLVIEPVMPLLLNLNSTDASCFGANDGSATVIATGGNSPYTYQWDSAAGNQTGATALALYAGSYSVSVTDSNGCTVIDSTILITEPPQLTLDSLVLTATDMCEGDSANVTGSYAGADSSFSYLWNNGLGTALGSFTVMPATTTTYILTLTDACVDSIVDTVIVKVFANPVISVDMLNFAGCVPLTLTFENNSASPNDSLYLWSFGDGVTSNDISPVYQYTSPGTYTVSLTITSNRGCVTQNSAAGTVVVHALPQVSCSADPQQTDSRNPTINFAAGGTGTSFSWDFGDGDTSSVQNPIHTYIDIGTYQVTLSVIDINKCENSCQLDVVIDPYYEIIVPTGFTPNPNGPGDGTYDISSLNNDVFFILTEFVDEFYMMIFNRWGELIFETDDINIGWDGYYHGQLCQQDAYAYKVRVKYIDGHYAERLGDITLIR